MSETCEYCNAASKYIAVEEYRDTRLFFSVTGSRLQVFDEEYPGFVTSFKINNCPMCGRPLDKEQIKIRTTKTIRGLMLPPLPPGEYPAGCNKNGAVYVKLAGGKTLGVKPGEFEFIEAPAWLLELWKEAGIE